MLRSIRLLAGAALLGGLALGCNKVDFGPDEGYTQRDANNYPAGHVDQSDWTSDQDWKKAERELFKDSGVDLAQPQLGGVGTLSWFPNPTVEQAVFYLQPGSSRLPNTAPALQGQAVLVDQKYRRLHTFDFQTRGGNAPMQVAVRLPTDKCKPGRLYRLYYIFSDANKALYLKGHGDIRVEE